LNEAGAERVRAVARGAPGLASCEFGRLEFVCALHRHLREGHLTAREARAVLGDLAADEASGVWRWLPVNSALLRAAGERVRRLPRSAALRAGDALHAAAAAEHGFGEIYTNDRHLMAACPHFGLRAIDVLASP
jgi:predicted nucleic acid-binding protein